MIKMSWTRLATLASGVLLSASAQAAWDLNMTKGVTPLSHEIYDLHMMIFYVCCVVGALVFGVMFYSIFAHRRSRHPKPATFHESTAVEIIWTAVPFFILVAVAYPSIGTLIRMEDTRNADLSVRVTGFQWGWKYDYVGENVGFYSRLNPRDNVLRQTRNGVKQSELPPNYLLEVDHRLIVPTGKKIRFLITARDVIHSWWVPALGMKMDAIPGYINEMWAKIDKPGVYRGQCAELCGRDHAFMPIVVQAVTPEKYQAWLAQEKLAEKDGSKDADVTIASLDEVSKPALEDAESAAASAPATGGDEGQAKAKSEEQSTSKPEAAEAKPEAAATPPAETADKTTDKAKGKAQESQAAGKSETESASKQQAEPAAKDEANAKAASKSAAEPDLDKATLMAEGKKVYSQYCSACHQESGKGMPPAFPALQGGKLVLGPVKGHIEQILHGKNAMQAFGPLLDDRQIAAVATYERNSWGNDSGVVQPAQVKALR